MAPIQATYKLEVWGAQGSWGGYGGYCYAEDMVSKNGTIYICVGQNTQSTSPSYNNGNISFSFYVGLSGGGATSLTSSNRGILANFKNYQNEVILVAGGGGSVEWQGTGGEGGYPKGGDGYSSPQFITYGPTGNRGTGGTQSQGGASDSFVSSNITHYTSHVNGDFGMGGYGETNGDYGAQGGGGWYGGGGASYAGAAGGGSSYVNPSLTNFKHSNGVRSGNGYAQISLK